MTTNLNEIAWGVEFETTMPAADPTPIGPYHRGIQVDWLPAGWHAERDSSIAPETAERKGCEFVSPKLHGYAGLREIEQAIDAMTARGAKVNSTCGLHVTVEWTGDAAALARLISLIGNHEQAIFAATGTRRRERTIYTKQIKPYANQETAKARCEADRYHLLNLTHLARGETLEAFHRMKETAQQEGITLQVLWAYRSPQLQRDHFEEAKRKHGRRNGIRWLAPPGFSEHQTGWVLDLGDGEDPEADDNPLFERTRAYRWLEKHAAIYHFELSFPPGNWQGVSYEPWHWRYVGTPEAQAVFHPQGIHAVWVWARSFLEALRWWCHP